MNCAISPTHALQLYKAACHRGEFFCLSRIWSTTLQILGLTQHNAVSCGYVLLFEITITRSRRRWDWHHVTNQPRHRAFCGWTQARDLIWGDLAYLTLCVQSPMNQECVTVALRVPGANLNEKRPPPFATGLFLLSEGSGALASACNVRAGRVLRGRI